MRLSSRYRKKLERNKTCIYFSFHLLVKGRPKFSIRGLWRYDSKIELMLKTHHNIVPYKENFRAQIDWKQVRFFPLFSIVFFLVGFTRSIITVLACIYKLLLYLNLILLFLFNFNT